MRNPDPTQKPAIRIVDQVRRSNVREYDLACGDGRLTVNVTPDRADETCWRVEVRGKRRGGETIVASESGPTRVDALRASSRVWRDAAAAHGLDIFDFEQVEQLLDEVRAL